ncbi:MAG: Ig-like domain-containing protein [Candidatus Thermoplasmatota archaeon]
MKRKWLTIGIVLLLIGITGIPSTAEVMGKDDTTPPVTTCALDPPDPDGQNGWYVNDVTVTLNATDNESGVNITYYRVNATSWEIYTEPFILSNDGSHIVIEYYSVDNAGNEETPKSVVLKIDKTPPEVTLSFYWEKIGDRYAVIVTVTCNDAWSGISKVEFYDNDELQETVTGAGPDYIWTYQYSPLRIIKIKVIVYDNAGHTNVTEIIIRSRILFAAGMITDLNDTGSGLVSFKAKNLYYAMFKPFELLRATPNEEIFVLREYIGYLGPEVILGVFTGIWIEYF